MLVGCHAPRHFSVASTHLQAPTFQRAARTSCAQICSSVLMSDSCHHRPLQELAQSHECFGLKRLEPENPHLRGTGATSLICHACGCATGVLSLKLPRTPFVCSCVSARHTTSHRTAPSALFLETFHCSAGRCTHTPYTALYRRTLLRILKHWDKGVAYFSTAIPHDRRESSTSWNILAIQGQFRVH